MSEIALTLTQSAVQHFLTLLSKNSSQQVIRLTIKTAGCSGFKYYFDFVEPTQIQKDLILQLDEKYQLFIDKKAYPFIKGSTIDFVQEGINHKIKFINPNEMGSCGCGESFYV